MFGGGNVTYHKYIFGLCPHSMGKDKTKRKPTALKGQKIFMEALKVFLILTAVGQA